MKIQFLGTAAYEGVPSMFCNCDVCRRSKALGGRNLRSRSQALIDDVLLIDFPADTYFHMTRDNLDFGRIHTCIITHNHSDHLYSPDIPIRGNHFSPVLEEDRPLIFYATTPGYTSIAQKIAENALDQANRVFARQIHAFQDFEADGYHIIPLKASHDPSCEPVFFIIEKGDKAILYANDTGLFPDETWSFLENYPRRFSLISLDCTMYDNNTYFGHMDLPQCAHTRDRLRKLGLVDDNTVCVVNHFSHNALRTYDDMAEAAAAYGMISSYDSMTLTF